MLNNKKPKQPQRAGDPEQKTHPPAPQPQGRDALLRVRDYPPRNGLHTRTARKQPWHPFVVRTYARRDRSMSAKSPHSRYPFLFTLLNAQWRIHVPHDIKPLNPSS